MSHDGVDRISSLPEPIVHHILSYLPTKDVDKTSALSKTFLSSWNSFPVIVLNYYNQRPLMHRDVTEVFKDSLHRSIHRRSIETDLRKFELIVPGGRKSEKDHRIDEAINFAMRKRVNELDLNFLYPSHTLPRFTDDSFNSITSLKLQGLRLENFHHLIVRCPHIQTLQIIYCSALERFLFSSDTIMSIQLEYCAGLKELSIKSLSLEKLLYNGLNSVGICGYKVNSNIINISECKFLKELSLSYAKITDEWVGNTIPLLAKLENLKFIGCREFEELKISNDSLKRLALLECIVSLKSLKIAARNFQSLNFNGSSTCEVEFGTTPHFSFISCHAEIPSYAPYYREERDVTLLIQAEGPLYDNYFVALLDFIESFRHCKVLTLICNSSEKLVIPEKLRGKTVDTFYPLKHLRIKGILSISSELVDSLLWLYPFFKTLTFVSDGVERSIKFFRDWEPEKDGTILCCSDLRRKCWRHYIKKLQLKNFNGIECISLMQYFAENSKVVDTIN